VAAPAHLFSIPVQLIRLICHRSPRFFFMNGDCSIHHRSEEPTGKMDL
jgi:hypothetical protein